MTVADGKYNIKAVSKMLSIQPGTLRAWERRYKIIEPRRNKAGHRLYTEQQVSILKWLIDKVNRGITIGQAVELYLAEDFKENESNLEIDDKVIQLRNDLLISLLEFDEQKSNQQLDQIFAMFSIEKIVIKILGELLIDVGDKWERGEITVAHEHFVTSYLRTKIGMVLHQLPVNRYLPKVLCVCGPGELHEMGLLIFTLYLKRKGYDTVYLGSGIPQDDLFNVVSDVLPKMVVLSCTMEENIAATMELAKKIDKSYSDIKVGIGGQAFKGEKEVSNKYYIGDFDDWEGWLQTEKGI
ncbi:MerR family transcriptional regulator [Evansella cellulosilytica]|uniref:Regulatory protein MerR n=1 Tax=Evansella cellulosilytica (strain ATCC 21833 / DSM 2522 / FERM P-1141 / JCM 9156 / N-4) TaxID=649639 RepID=E6TYQ1_EVAC2|nr:cobalamin-dependent protein [Evansella cellulosilytica]ADU30101.1 regulatory protein MerR [Evansella cellulosilytica DSM 2522]